jgi:hypothetical protein
MELLRNLHQLARDADLFENSVPLSESRKPRASGNPANRQALTVI